MELSLTAGAKNPTFDHIVDRVYLGDADAAQKEELLRENNIGIIVNISNTRYCTFDGIEYYYFDIDDDRNENISQFFPQLVNIIESNPEKNILIHCMNSVSRSVSLVLYFLMRIKCMQLMDAYIFLKSKRNQYTKPNCGFIKQLISEEKNIFGVNTIKLTDFYKK